VRCFKAREALLDALNGARERLKAGLAEPEADGRSSGSGMGSGGDRGSAVGREEELGDDMPKRAMEA
jgi:hypothetical protein